LINVATATGVDGNGDPVNDADTHTLDIEYRPALIIQKHGPTTTQVSRTVHYTYTLAHAPGQGDGSIVSDIDVTDDAGLSVYYVRGDNGNGLLEPAETWIFGADYTTNAADPSTLVGDYTAMGRDRDDDIIIDAHNFVLTIEGIIRPRLYLPIVTR
jgi:hypothetical protein